MKRSSLRLVGLGLALAVVVGGVAIGKRYVGGGGGSPSILLFILDTTRADSLSCYGNPRPTSPNIDLLAREATLYLRARSPSPWTAPSVGSIFTGYLPSEHGLHLENMMLGRSRETVAELLQEAGYQTAAFSNSPFISSQYGLEQGFDLFVDVWPLTERMKPKVDEGAAITNRLLRAWFERERDADRPFFLVVHYMEPHLPYRPPPPYAERFVDPEMDPQIVDRVRGWAHPYELGYILGETEISEEEFRAVRMQYDGEVGYTDEKVGEVLDLLREHGSYEETLIIVTADHGENLGEHQLMDHKFSLYETVLHVPLIVRYPPPVKGGVRVSHPVQTTDIFPTILSVAGIRNETSLHGRSLLDDTPEDRPTYGQWHKPTVFLDVMDKWFPDVSRDIFDRRLFSVEKGGLKLIWSSDGQNEMYDLEEDPGETRNILKDRPDEAAALQERIIR